MARKDASFNTNVPIGTELYEITLLIIQAGVLIVRTIKQLFTALNLVYITVRQANSQPLALSLDHFEAC